MRFALFVPFHRLDPSEPIQSVYGDALEQVLFAEDSGFDVVWFPEQHLSNMIACPHPLTAVTWAAQHTSRIRLGTAVVVLPYYHPLSLAEEVGMVDALSGGRLELGIGKGGYKYEHDRYQLTEAEASQRMYECFEAVLQAWGEPDGAFAGKFWAFPPSSARPRPVQSAQSGHPPVWVAARSPNTVRWAVRHGFNLLATPQRDPFSRVQTYVKDLHEIEAELQPTQPPKLAISRMTCVTDDSREARQTMEVVWRNHCINRHLHSGTARVWQGHVQPDPLPEAETLTADTLLENLVVGDPETCVRKLRQYEALGVDQYIVYADFGQEQEKVMRSLSRFVADVMPHFAKTPAVSARA